MADRMELQKKLCSILGTNNVYFEPPENIKIDYPCFIYELEIPLNVTANNQSYILFTHYNIVYIDSNPDNDMIKKLIQNFKNISAGNPYTVNNLHHYPFDLYI